MKKNKKIWSYALATALAVSNLSGVVAAPFSTIMAQAAPEQSSVVIKSANSDIKISAIASDFNGSNGIYAPNYGQVTVSGDAIVPAYGKLILMAVTGSGNPEQIAASSANGDDEASISYSGEIANAGGITSAATTTYKLYSVVRTGEGTEQSPYTWEVANGTLIESLTVNYVERKQLTTKNDMNGKTTLNDVTDTIYAGGNSVEIKATLGTIDKSTYIHEDATFGLTMVDADDTNVDSFVVSDVTYATMTASGISGAFTATSKGTYTAKLWYDADGDGVDFEPIVINTKSYTAVQSAIQSIEITEANETTVLVDKNDFTGQKYELSLTAVATADDASGVPDALAWGVYAADDTTYSKNLAATGGIFANKVTTGTNTKHRTTITSKATINSVDIAGGSYVAAAYKVENGKIASVVGTYPFTVVAIPTATIQAQNDDRTTTNLYEGSTGKLKLYLNGAYKDSYKSAKFKLTNSTDSAYVDLASDGTFTIKKYNATPIAVELVSYDLGSGVTLKGTASSITIVPSSVTAIWVDDGDAALESMVVGEELPIKVTYGSTDITKDVTYSVTNSKYVSVKDGVVTALEETASSVKITATYGNKGKADITLGKIIAVEYGVVNTTTDEPSLINTTDDQVPAPGSVEVRPGKSVEVELVASNEKDITDTVTWKSKNISTATVTGNGTKATISVPTDAEVGDDAVINVYLGGTTDEDLLLSFTVVVPDAAYSATAEEKTLGGTVTAGYTATLFNTETLTLTAYYDGEVVDGKWALKSGIANNSITLKGNVVTATTSPESNDSANVVEFTPSGEKSVALKVTVTVAKDTPVLYKNGSKLNDTTPTVTQMEVGESIAFTIKDGAKDVTANYIWKSSDDAVSVEDGVITAVYEASGIDVKAYASAADAADTETDKSKVTVTITKVIESTGAADDAAAATDAAVEASIKADAAITAAETAQKAAEATKTAPTAENLTKAEEALKTANSDLAAAQKALKDAEADLAKAEADGAVSDTAKAAVKEAKKAVEEAEKAVAVAEKTVAAAQKTFDEAATEVEKAKKAADEKAAEEKKAADQAVGATGTDTASGAGYKVTDTAAKTVEFTGTTATGTSFTIPATVTIDGETFAVTKIAANAFKGTGFTTVTIGSNIKDIDPNAFKNSNVKTVKLGTKLNKNSAKFVNGMKKKSTVKCTGSKKVKTANKKLLKKQKAVKKGKVKVK